MSNNPTKSNGSVIAIVTMMFLYAMIAFVTNLAAPIGVVMKNDPEILSSDFSNTLAMMGNMMVFLAYLFMGIPAGKMLVSLGYKKTALLGIGLGFVGVLVQFISGFETLMGYTDNIVYLIGAFISGMSVCLLNTVVNPMLNLLGGGGNRGNQLNMMGGTFNSLAATFTPMFVGALIGQVTAESDFTDINLVLYIAMAVFAIAFVVLAFIPIKDPEQAKVTSQTQFEHSPWNFRHFVLGAVAIFLYVGIEVGIPGTLNLYMNDTTAKGAGLLANAATIAGLVVGVYWLLMLVGRIMGSSIAGKVSSRAMMICVSTVAICLIIGAMMIDKSVTTSMPVFNSEKMAIVMETVPVSAVLFVLCGLCTSVMWSCIFNLATEGLGKYTAAASGIFMMMVVGGGVLPLVQTYIADGSMGYLASYIVPLLGLAYILFYALIGCKNVNKDIPVD